MAPHKLPWLVKLARSQVQGSRAVSHQLACRFSTNAWSKPLSLLYCTLAVVYFGGLGIYVVSGHSLYAAFWQVWFPSAHALPWQGHACMLPT